MSLLGPHVIGEPGSLREFCTATQPAVIKYLNPAEREKITFAPITVGRIHPISEDDTGLLTDPAALGRKHAAELSVHAARTGIALWEGLNERNPDTPQKAAAMCAYEQARVAALNAVGLSAVVCNFGVGWPAELPDGRIDWEPFRDLLERLAAGNYLGLHEYRLPRDVIGPHDRAARFGRLLRCPYDVPILVTECGIDVAGGQEDGFRGQGIGIVEYAGMLGKYDDLLALDPRVRGATVFCYRDPFGEWQKFNLWPDWRAFVDVFAARPRREPVVYVSQYSSIFPLGLTEYLRGVVPAEMGAEQLSVPDDPDAPDGPHHPEDSARGALLVQAVAARSYTLWRLAHPRSPAFALYGDTRDQAYDRTRIHICSDEAVRATTGVQLVKGGQPFEALYVSTCGLAGCPYCDGHPGRGHQGHDWPGRLCQFGAHRMARDGVVWRDIIRRYYGTDIQFSDEVQT
jgi:hypothetical protein